MFLNLDCDAIVKSKLKISILEYAVKLKNAWTRNHA